MEIAIPQLSLVLLTGPVTRKKSFAEKHFRDHPFISLELCRTLISDRQNGDISKDAKETLMFLVRKRLKRGLLTVVDIENEKKLCAELVDIAKTNRTQAIAIIFSSPAKPCEYLPDDFKKEGFQQVYFVSSRKKISLKITPALHDKREERGPFDIIGDIHGCFDELLALLKKLDYIITIDRRKKLGYKVTHPDFRKIIFLGDLVDRGPKIVEVLKLAMAMVTEDKAFCVLGNHDWKLLRKLSGRHVKINHGLENSLEQLENTSVQLIPLVREFITTLPSHYILDQGNLVVAHAGLKASLQGRDSGATRAFALYGDTTGKTDEFGMPVRRDWAANYKGKALMVYGHTPVAKAMFNNHTINIDTGCVFGGELTALRYPEKEIVGITAQRQYCRPSRPFLSKE